MEALYGSGQFAAGLQVLCGFAPWLLLAVTATAADKRERDTAADTAALGVEAAPPASTPEHVRGPKPDQHERHFWAEVVATACGGLCCGLGLVVILGWFLRVPLVTHIRAAFTPMVFNTALAFVIGGAALVLAVRRARLLVRICGTLLALFGLLTIAEYLLGIDFGIDQLLFTHYALTGDVYPGRMALNTAVALVLAGPGLLLVSTRARLRGRPLTLAVLGSGVAALGLVSLLGYLAGIGSAYGWGRYKDMAAHTALGFVVLGAGMIALAWDDSGREAPRWLPVPVGIGLCSATLLLWHALMVLEQAHQTRTALPPMALSLGLLMSLLTIATVHLAQRARHRARQFEAINRVLESEISWRKQAEQARELLSEVLEASTDYVSTSEMNGTTTYINPAGRSMIGLSPDHPPGGLGVADVYPRWAAAVIQREGIPVAVERGSWRGETALLSREGQEIPVSQVIVCHRGADGKPAFLSTIMRDISERKQAQEELRKASLYARGLLEASLDPLVTIRKDGRIMDVNQAAELVTGKAREQLIGSDFSDYFTEPEKARQGYQQVFAQGLVQDYPLAIRHTSGRITDVLYNAVLFRNEAGEVEGVFAAARDITDRKKAEQALERYAAELERSNAELADFASIASHDLQEPLRKVMAFGERLSEHSGSQLDAQGQDFLQRMCNAARRMSGLIEALLQYSRLNTRAQPFAPVDLGAVLKEVLADLEARIAESNAELEIGPMPKLWGDATQLRQLLQNLLSNALKFHRPGTVPRVRLSGRPAPQGAGWELTVSDDGTGFDEKYLERIFRPFQRLHGRSEFAGSGMGLAICRKIAARHGGAITAHSTPEQGATFTVFLPEKAEEGKNQ